MAYAALALYGSECHAPAAQQPRPEVIRAVREGFTEGFGTFASLIEPSTSYLHCFIRATGAHGGFPDERLALFSIILVVPNILPQTLGPPVALTP
jgi:hypothetical protein